MDPRLDSQSGEAENIMTKKAETMVPLGSPGGAALVACRSVITSILITLLLTVDERTRE